LDLHGAIPMPIVAGVCALLLAAPFEARTPVIALPGQSLSTVEAVLLIVLAGAVWVYARNRGALRVRGLAVVPWIAFLAAMGLAAAAAPAHVANAVNMTMRFALAFGVYVVVAQSAASDAAIRRILIAATISGVLVAALAILEYLGAAAVVRWLTAFRINAAHVGGQLRAAGPFQYPTIASMFLEIAFAFAVALVLVALDRRRLRDAAAAFAAAALISQGIVFTLTRAGIITMAVTLALLAWQRHRRCGPDRGLAVVGLLTAVVVAQIAGSRSIETLRLRLTTETMNAWFRAAFESPRDLAMATGATATVPIRVTNAGGATWDSNASPRIRLSYHWLESDSDAIVSWEGLRTDFASPVPPGATVSVDAAVVAPPVPGDYRLMWDIEQEHRLWFSTEPEAPIFTARARIAGPVVAGAMEPPGRMLPRTAVRPGRAVLWRAALGMFAARPLTGIGPDNYRLSYGERAGLANFDRRVHANNMYLEVLVGGGLVGAAAFVWLGGHIVRRTVAALRGAAAAEPAMLAAGVAAATLAIAVHGLVDSFLSFTGTYIPIATTLGLGAALGARHELHAHRL
jgi:hypothetical protein